ncbi:PEP/pyruvate-binding domain-containing protein [Streptomyces sp. NPDC005374]|uniref:PEP/pyruvate-binding domain-containing protein n=1 Tax=Streptomyces sp. NPDC005374 TaxID=3364713 RepID=UPI00368086C7
MGNPLAQLAVVALGTEQAKNPAVTGARAANLARSAVAGLPVLPGFVLVPADRAPGAPAGGDAVHGVWQVLDDIAEALVVRPSSVHGDTEEFSAAGPIDPVPGVRGWEAFQDAVRAVLDPARQAQLPGPPDGGTAVLVQPMLRAAVGGVLSTADPVTGHTDRLLVTVVSGEPGQLVDGGTQGVHYQLTRFARLVRTEPPEPARRRLLPHRRITRLVALAKKTERVLGGPVDLEFAFDVDGKLWLYQARPITTATARAAPGAKVDGPTRSHP